MGRQLGAVAAGHERTARAGAEALADGGNAVDAAVAAVFAACTCEPTLTGLGGAGFSTVYDASTHTCTVLDFFAAVPGIGRSVEGPGGPVPVDVMFGTTTQTFHVGPQSCAVPGFVAGVLRMHDRWGRLPRRRVLEPGIELARRGLALTPQQAYCHRLLEAILRRRPEGEQLFARGGRFLEDGDHFAQPGLADSLELLADAGVDGFYRGDLAREIARWADDHGGLISLSDLEAYRVREHNPVRSTYRDLDLFSVPPPSSGGALVAYALRLLDRASSHEAVDIDTPFGARLLVAAMIAANVARGATFDDHLYGEGLVEWLLSEHQIAQGLRDLEDAMLVEGSVPSSRLGSTTHLSVIDAEGNGVAMTTSTGCGSGELVGTTGIHLNNMLGEEDLVPVERKLVPGDRLTSMMAPSLFVRSGRPIFATGSAGSNRLRSAIVQTLVRVVESRHAADDATLQERLSRAAAAGRLHAEAGLIHAEPDVSDAVVTSLRHAGHAVNEWPSPNLYFGGVNMVAVDLETGTFAAAADPRRGGGVGIALEDGSIATP